MAGLIRANCALGHELTVSELGPSPFFGRNACQLEWRIGQRLTRALPDRLSGRGCPRFLSAFSVSEIPSESLKDSEGEYSAE